MQEALRMAHKIALKGIQTRAFINGYFSPKKVLYLNILDDYEYLADPLTEETQITQTMRMDTFLSCDMQGNPTKDNYGLYLSNTQIRKHFRREVR